MNFYTVGNLRADIDANLHSGGTSQLNNFYATADKGRRAMIGKVRPEELIRKVYLEQAIYPSVDRYAVPDDLKYDDILEINQLSSYRNVDTQTYPLEKVYRRRFGQKRSQARNVINIGYENGIKYARIFHPRGLKDFRHQVIHNFDSLTDNGTFNVGGNVVDLRLDELNHVSGKAALSFDINNSGTTGFIENFTLKSVNLEDFLQTGATFTWLNIPLPLNLLSVKLTLGSNTNNLLTDLLTSVVNQPHDNISFTTGWNLLKYMMNNLTVVGTPNPKDIKYIRFDFTTTGLAIPNMGIDIAVSRKGSVYEALYNSSYVFQDAFTKAIKKVPTANSDIIIAEEDTYEILMWESTLAAQKEIYGSNIGAKTDVSDIQQMLDSKYERFFMEHPSEALLTLDDMRIYGNEYDGLSAPIENDDFQDFSRFHDNNNGN